MDGDDVQLTRSNAGRGPKAILISFALAFSAQSIAQPEIDVPVEIQQDYIRNCATEVGAMRQYMEGVGVDSSYDPNQLVLLADTITTLRLPSNMYHPGLATVDELRLLEATVFSRESDSDPRQTQIRAALRQCAMRVAIGHLEGNSGARAPGGTSRRPAVVTPGPSSSATVEQVVATRQPIDRMTLFEAVSSGDIGRVRQLLDTGEVTADMQLDSDGNRPLHVAAERCSVPMVQLLLSRGAATNVLNKWNDNPVTIASVRCGPQSFVTQVVRAGPSNSGASQSRWAANEASRRGTAVHNPALEATSCVRVVPYGTPGSDGFTQSILNECGRVVEVSWCSLGGECERDSGNSWTLSASGVGSGYPVGNGTVRYAACFGRNSGGLVQGSQGQRMICTGEAGQ